MKTDKLFLINFFLVIILTDFLSAQSIEVHNFIGKSRNEVIKKFGNPVHKDESNPDMICMFYKAKSGSMIFVSDKEGIYQAEATKTFDTQSEARNNIDKFISYSLAEGFSVDTVSTTDYQLHGKGTKADLQLFENKISKTFELRVKANKSENY